MLFGAIHDGGTDESDCKIIYKKLKYFVKNASNISNYLTQKHSSNYLILIRIYHK